MDQNQMKKRVAEAALIHVTPESIIGIGTGSTVDYFIDCLATIKHTIEGTVASSFRTETKLREHRIPVFDLNTVNDIDIYIDGADEVNDRLQMIKGGGGALVREKILATAAKKFICLVDQSKQVNILGKKFPLPVEVIPMARSLVARQCVELGGNPVYREGFVTDNGNTLLDVYGLDIAEPLSLESKLNNTVGLVEHGLFATRHADVLLVCDEMGRITTVEYSQR